MRKDKIHGDAKERDTRIRRPKDVVQNLGKWPTAFNLTMRPGFKSHQG